MLKFIWAAVGIIVLPVAGSALELDVEHYANHSHPQWTWAIESLMDHPVSEGIDILDIGSGDGKIAAHLASLVGSGSVVGLDSCEEAVVYASQQHEAGNLSFIHANAEDFQLHQTFDLITAFCAVHWLADKEAFLENVKCHLKPNGKLFLVGPEREGYEELIESAGFHIDFVEHPRTTIVMENQEAIRNWLLAIRSDLRDQDEALTDATNRMRAFCELKYPQAGDGRIYAFPNRLVIQAHLPPKV